MIAIYLDKLQLKIITTLYINIIYFKFNQMYIGIIIYIYKPFIQHTDIDINGYVETHHYKNNSIVIYLLVLL